MNKIINLFILSNKKIVDLNDELILTDYGYGISCFSSYDIAYKIASWNNKEYIYKLEFNDNNLKYINYDVNKEWLISIAYFRKQLETYKENRLISSIEEKLANAEIVIAPYIDKIVDKIINLFITNEITYEQLKHIMHSVNIDKQCIILSKELLNKINIIDEFIVDIKKREYIKELIIAKECSISNKIKEVKSIYNKGTYINEILNK